MSKKYASQEEPARAEEPVPPSAPTSQRNLVREQSEVASAIAERLEGRLQPKYAAFLREAQSAAEAAFTTVDEEAAQLVWRSDVLRDVQASLVGYTDWLATRLYRAYRATGQPLADRSERPDMSNEDISAISNRYHVEPDMIELVLEDIYATPTRLPFVGRLRDNHVLLDSTELTQWADRYSW